MQQLINALIALLIIATVSLFIAKRPFCEVAIPAQAYDRRRIVWILVVSASFLSPDYFVFAAIAAVLIYWAGSREASIVPLYLWLIFAVPVFSKEIPGFAGIRYIIALDYVRLLSIVLLLPTALRLWSAGQGPGRGSYPTDYLVLGYALFETGQRLLGGDSFTNSARATIHALLDVLLPYYVCSRGIRSIAQLRDVLASFVLAIMVLAVVSSYEFLTSWNFYRRLESSLNANWGYGDILARSGWRRATGSAGHPISMGYVMVVGLCMYGCVQLYIRNRLLKVLGWAVLACGLFASISRGPWVGAAVGVLVLKLAGPERLGGLVKTVTVASLIAVAVVMSPFGDAVIDLLPFVGTVESQNVEYRAQLMEVSVGLIAQSPWFGVPGYMDALVDNNLVIGGMVDVVNTYLGVGLAQGVPALLVFVGCFVWTAWSIWRALSTVRGRSRELHMMGAGFVAAIAGTMVTIMTTSSITIIPLVYWTLLGLSVAWVSLVTGNVRVPYDTSLRSRQNWPAPESA